MLKMGSREPAEKALFFRVYQVIRKGKARGRRGQAWSAKHAQRVRLKFVLFSVEKPLHVAYCTASPK